MSQALRDKTGNYLINGRKYKSVTTIIHEEYPRVALDAWKERTPDWPVKARQAQIYGTLMHMRLQSTVVDIPVDVPGELPFYEWPEDILEELEGRDASWEGLNLVLGKPNLVEHTIIIEDRDESGEIIAASAGTWDFWGPVDGMMSLLDWKSSKRPQKAHRIQMGAYYLGAKHAGIVVEWGLIPYIQKNKATIVEMSPDEMQEEGEKFLELARKSYERSNGYSGKCKIK